MEMAQCVNVLAAQPEDLSSISGNHIEEEIENQFYKNCSLTLTHILEPTFKNHSYTRAGTHTQERDRQTDRFMVSNGCYNSSAYLPILHHHHHHIGKCILFFSHTVLEFTA